MPQCPERVSCCALFFFTTSGPAAWAGDQTAVDWEHRFRTEYPAAVSKLRKSLENLAARGAFENHNSGSDVKGTVRFWHLNDWAKCEFLRATREEARCFSADKSFILERQNHQLPWHVKQVYGSYRADKRALPSRMFQIDQYCNALFFSASHDDWETWVFDQSVIIDSVQPLDSTASLDELRVVVRAHKKERPAPSWANSGAVTLAPSRSWAICASTMEIIVENAISWTNSSVVEPRNWNGVWFPERIELRSTTVTNDGQSLTGTQIFTCEDVTLGQVTPADFTMTSYSLPELPPSPDRVNTRAPGRSNWLLWLSINLAIVLIAVCAVLKKWQPPQK